MAYNAPPGIEGQYKGLRNAGLSDSYAVCSWEEVAVNFMQRGAQGWSHNCHAGVITVHPGRKHSR